MKHIIKKKSGNPPPIVRKPCWWRHLVASMEVGDSVELASIDEVNQLRQAFYRQHPKRTMKAAARHTPTGTHTLWRTM